MGAPCSAPIQGCAERQWGTAIFSRGHQMGNIHILPRVIGSVASPWLRLVSLALPRLRRRWRGFPSPLSSRHPGLAARATRRDRWRGRATGSIDPIPWIVRVQRAASGGRGLRRNPKRRHDAALDGRGARGVKSRGTVKRAKQHPGLLRRKPERRRVCALQTRCPGASDRPLPPRLCFPRFYSPNSRTPNRLPEGGEDISQGPGRARQGRPRPLESWTFFDTRALTGRGEGAEAGRAATGSETFVGFFRSAVMRRPARRAGRRDDPGAEYPVLGRRTARTRRVSATGPVRVAAQRASPDFPAPAPGRGRRLGDVFPVAAAGLSGPALPRGTRG